MSTVSLQVGRFIRALKLSGTLLMLLGAVAVRWPDEALGEARPAAAILLALVGTYQFVLARRVRRASAAWLVGFASAAASIAMAVMTAIVSVFSLRAVTVLLAIWLLALAALMTAGALALWPMIRTRTVLLVWSACNVMLAGLALWTRPSMVALLYAGAAYAVAVGASQVAAGTWMCRFAEPWVAPTVQSGWSPPGNAHRRQET